MADSTGLQWDWAASCWEWDPASGPWRPENGGPADTVRFDISTAGLPGNQAYDFWRNMVFYNFSAQRPNDEQRRRYHAEGTGFFTAGAAIGISSTDSLFGGRHIAQHRADGLDDITIGYVAEGMRWQVDEDGEHRATNPLRRRGRSMAAADMGHLFPAMTALAQAALAPAGTPETDAGEPGRLAAACRFIRAHLGDEDLSPDRIAAAIGCSRATLYRLFADHPMTIAEYVRECRLQAAMTTLSGRSGGSVSSVAARLGFTDPSTFSQAFRRRFGVSPRDVGRSPVP